MFCKKCKKQIPDNSVFCNLCGKRQDAPPKKRAHKRAHGSGTIHRDNRYHKPYIALSPLQPNGKRLYIGAYSTYGEAQMAIDDYIRNGRPELYNATLEQIYKLWSAGHYRQVSDSAVKLYSSMWKRFAPLYRVKMADIRTAHFQPIIDSATSKSTAETLKVLASMLCDYAAENDIVQKNYAEFIKIPKFGNSEKMIFNPKQIATLWEHTDDSRVQVILSMIYMGFRIGEISALTVDNVHISEGYVIAGEKTEAGKNRIIPFPAAIPEISGFFEGWCRNAAPNGKLFDYSSTVFRNRIFYGALRDLGMIEFTKKGESDTTPLIFPDKNHLTPHSTRHTFASLSAAAGFRPELLQKIIGHANYSTTADIYVHKNIEQLKAEMSKLMR